MIRGSTGAAPGYRHEQSGVLRSVGYFGYSWSLSPSAANAYSLRFYLSGIGLNISSRRAVGLQLRCLQE
ncbi:MAG: hypothetical protein K2G93_07765 [Rikenella sp.]|nr:hypothetical protein [Rikenella sp.]